MNYFKNNADTISVKALLDNMPGIPSYEEVATSDRDYNRRIIKPFEDSLDALVDAGIFTEWHYCHTNDTPLTDSELQELNYDIFITLNIRIIWQNYPTLPERTKPKPKKSHKKSDAEE